MIAFTTRILKFGNKGEKTGWTYIEVPVDIAQKFKPRNKKSFRVKGKLDSYSFKQVALIPMGGGTFIIALNASLRKAIGKRHGAMLKVKLEIDDNPYKLNTDLVACLTDEPKARANFKKLPPSHQNYFSKWIDSAKKGQTRIKRITKTINALVREYDFGKMLREAIKGKDVFRTK